MKFVIYKELGILKTTDEENYKAIVSNERKTQRWEYFHSANEIIEYCIKNFGKSKDDFIDKT